MEILEEYLTERIKIFNIYNFFNNSLVLNKKYI